MVTEDRGAESKAMEGQFQVEVEIRCTAVRQQGTDVPPTVTSREGRCPSVDDVQYHVTRETGHSTRFRAIAPINYLSSF